MSSINVLLIVTVVIALGFDFTNGFHDTANAVATSISTRALGPRTAVALSALFNLLPTRSAVWSPPNTASPWG
jgi:PiT family inorganic phosphate transporter